jgi:hypothetical protein
LTWCLLLLLKRMLVGVWLATLASRTCGRGGLGG